MKTCITHRWRAGGLSSWAKYAFLRLLLVSALCYLALPAGAVIRDWTGAVNGYWSEPNNWDPAGTPTNNDLFFFRRTDDANRSMTNDLVNLSVRGLLFGAEENDHNYELYGNTVRLTGDGRFESQPDGNSTVTINCPLVFEDGGSVYANPLGGLVFQTTANVYLNGSITIEDGELELIPWGSEGLLDARAHIYCYGTISGPGRVRARSEDYGTVNFTGPLNNTFTGGLFLDTSADGRVIFDKTAGYVVTNLLVVSNAIGRLELNSPNQVGLATVLRITDGGQFELSGSTLNVGGLIMSNRFASRPSPVLDTGTSMLGLLGALSTSVPTNGQTPIIRGQLNLSSGDHLFNVSSPSYEGLSIEAQIVGPGGFTKTGNAALLLQASNLFLGPVTVNSGELDVRDNHALGAVAGSTVIGGGSLTLRNVAIGQEVLLAQGQGTGGTLPGSVLTVIGTSAWAGPVTLQTNLVVVGGDMSFTGPISGTGGLGCFSGGTMTIGGVSANTYTGPTLARCPLLQLNKPFGVNAYAGPLEVGGGAGGSYEVHWLNSRQNPNTSLTIFANGVVNLGANTEDFGPVTFNGGLVQTTPGILGGYFYANNSITANPATSPAVIDGNLALYANPAYFNISNGVAEPDLQVNAVISGVNVIKQGQGTLRFTGANTYVGVTTIADGILQADHASALGTTGAETFVGVPATLRLGAVNGMAEPIQLFGHGFQGTNGAIQVSAGGTIDSYIWLWDSSTINVLQGAGLTINNRVAGYGPLTKNGPGNLSFAGNQANTYSGNTLVNAGTLFLAKNANVAGVPGNLIIGPASASLPAAVQWLSSGGMQAGAIATVNINSVLNLNGNNQTLAQLNLNDGGEALTGSGTLNFTAGGSVNVGTLNPGLPGLQRSASISGKIALPVLDYLTFNVSGYGQTPLTSDPELDVPALISGGGNIVKNGVGTMRLSGANTFNDSPPFTSGDLLIYGGGVIAANSSALGGPAGWTLVYNGARLALVGNIAINNETLYLNSTNSIALDNPGGNNVWNGPITLSRDSGIGVNLDWSLTTTGVIGGPGSLTKVGAGALWLAGAQNNTHTGNTFVHEGWLGLSKSPFLQAVPANLIIGKPSGGTPASVLHVSPDQVWGNITVNNGGGLNLNDYNEYTSSLILNGGGDVYTGVGTLHFTSLAVNPGSFADQSVISGRIGLNAGSVPCAVGPGSLGAGVADCLISAVIVQSSTAAGLLKNGSGVLRLTGNNTYTGQTYINNGTLQVDGTQPQSPVTLDHETRLQGSGTVGHVILNGEATAIAPGTSPGTLTCSNLVASDGSGSLEIELNGTTAGIGYDHINVRGAVDLFGLKLSASLGFNSTVGNQFTIINNDGSDAVAGTFTGLAQSGKLYIGGELFQINYSGGTGNDVVLTRLATPPPPVLSIQHLSTNSVRLVWATIDPPFRLQSNTNLTTANWLSVLPLPAVVGTNHVLTNFTSGTVKLYRLINP